MCRKNLLRRVVLVSALIVGAFHAWSQCGGIMEPGFAFLSSSKGCAPFTVNIQTLYLSSVPGTKYFVNWGDGTAEQTYIQVGPTGVNISHLYPGTSVNCGYDVVIDAENTCNPRGSVVAINTQVVVWTNDVISISPTVYRVCQGYAADVLFTDNSDWNCFPRATRENNDPRWIQWIYGTGPIVNQIPGANVNSILPGAYPYLDPAPARNPKYPVLSPGQVSLPINVPVTAPADIGKEFEVTLKNWNQCNAYDNNILDGNPFNPIGGDLINGDNAPQITSARIVIVDAPQPDFLTRLGTAGGVVQAFFCVGDNIYFDNETPPIGGASFKYTWQFFNNNTGIGVPLSSSGSTNPIFSYLTSGQKLIRLSVRDMNAAGNCVAIFDKIVTISPSLIAKIGVTDLLNNPLIPDFCQNSSSPKIMFNVRFNDISSGLVTPTTLWRWEFYDESNALVRQEPLGGGFSVAVLGPFDLSFINRGIYRVKLVIRDNITSCETTDEVQVKVYENPVALFSATRVCEGQLTVFSEASTLATINGEAIILREWDFNYNGSTFNKDPLFDNKILFPRLLGVAGIHQVALRVTTNKNSCSSILVVPVNIDPLPNASFVPDVVSGCSILTVNFTNTSVMGQPDLIDRYVWEIDDKSGSGFVIAATHIPATPGFSAVFTRNFENVGTVNKVFEVRLRVVTINNCERISATTNITVFPGTASGFISTNYSPFNGNCSPQTVSFKVDLQTQSLNPSDYRWRISDASGIISETSTGIVSAFSYNFINATQALQDYDILLLTTLSTGCFGDSTRTIRISPIPDSDFEIDTLLYDCDRMKIKLSALQKGLMEYRWEISENNVVVVNSTSSSDFIEYEVLRKPPSGSDVALKFNLATKNFANCGSGITIKSIVVPKRDGVNASFTLTPKQQTLPDATVLFVNTTTPGLWGYHWDFGDSTTSMLQQPGSHTYKTFGDYTVSLKVKTNTCYAVFTDRISILATPPIIDFEYAPPSGCVPLTVKFTNLSQFGEPDKFVLLFGDGQATSKAIDPVYTYYQPGKYSVTLSATNATRQSSTVTKQMIIEAYPMPDAQFSIKPKLVYAPEGIMYTSNRSFKATSFLWDFGDGEISTLPEPQHSYKNEGLYTITLTAKNEFGCYDTARLDNVVRVVKSGQVLIPNAFSPNLSGSSGGGVGNGKNDMFLPLMRGVVEFEMVIFNRWGVLLFESRDSEKGWDGYYNGKLCAQDVYVYKLMASFENGQKIVRVGDINLIR